MPKVSVIIPTYNRTAFLRRAIESVLRQTYEDFDIIVVDDASREDVQGIINDFHDSRIRLIRHEVSTGEAGARNTGIRNSQGEYMAFLDDDDEWLPEKLALQVAILETSSKRVGGVYTGYIAVNFAEQQVLYRKVPSKRGDIYRDLLRRNVIGTPSTVLIRRACIEKAGLFDGSIFYGIDCDLYLRIAKHFHFEYVEAPLVKYYIHNERITNNPEIVSKGLEAMSRKYADERGFLSERRILSDGYLSVGVNYCFRNNTIKGRKAFLKSILMNPFQWKSYFNLGLSLFGSRNFVKLKKLKNRVIFPLRKGQHYNKY